MWLANQLDAFSMAVLITNISEPAGEPYCGKKWRNMLHSLIGTLWLFPNLSEPAC
jgi:hypothetical protein